MITQLGPAIDLFTFEILAFEDILLGRDTYGADITEVATGRPDAVSIGGIVKTAGSGRWEGSELHPGMWTAYGTGGVHASTGRSGHVNGELPSTTLRRDPP